MSPCTTTVTWWRWSNQVHQCPLVDCSRDHLHLEGKGWSGLNMAWTEDASGVSPQSQTDVQLPPHQIKARQELPVGLVYPSTSALLGKRFCFWKSLQLLDQRNCSILPYHFILQNIQKPTHQIFWGSCIITDFV